MTSVWQQQKVHNFVYTNNQNVFLILLRFLLRIIIITIIRVCFPSPNETCVQVKLFTLHTFLSSLFLFYIYFQYFFFFVCFYSLCTCNNVMYGIDILKHFYLFFSSPVVVSKNNNAVRKGRSNVCECAVCLLHSN